MARIISCKLGVPMILGGASGNAASMSALSVLLYAGVMVSFCRCFLLMPMCWPFPCLEDVPWLGIAQFA